MDGRDIPIKQLVEEFKKGKTNYVYSSTKDGDIKFQKIENAFKTKVVNRICKITLDNNEIIECTPEHLFMLRDGTYKEAQYLNNTDSLMPLNIKLSDSAIIIKNNNDNMFSDKGYFWVLNNKTGKYDRVHRMVAKQYYGELPKDHHTHHINFNSLNNNPENLEYKDSIKHISMHSKLNNNLLIAYRKKMKEDPEYFEKNWKKFHTLESAEKRKKSLKKYFENEENREYLSKKTKEQWKDEELRKWRSEKTKQQMANPEMAERIRQSKKRTAINKGLDVVNYMLINNIEFNKDNYNNTKKDRLQYKSYPKYETLVNSFKDIDDLLNQAKNYNHKIKFIEIINYEDGIEVYDLTVPPYDNFALSAGVFVHNSAIKARYREFQAI